MNAPRELTPPVVIHDRIERLPISALVPYARNSRTHSDEQLAQIAASMREFGFTNPVLIDEQGGIVAGHGRVMAAQRLGMDHVPCLRLAGLTQAQRRAYVIADNQIALNASWDDAMLRLELADLQAADFNLDLLGFDADRLDELLADADEDTDETEGLTDDDEVPEAPDHPVTKAGDVWLLGGHRITCGSCRDSKDVKRLLAGVKINLAFTSPPYAAQRTYDESSGFKPIDPDQYVQWYADVAANIHSNLADDGSYFCNIKEHAEDGVRHTYVKRLLLTHLDAWGWRWVDEFCWIRQGIPGDAEGMGRFRNAWESIFWFSKNKRPKFNPKAVRHVSEGAFSYADQVAAGKTIGAKNQGAGSASNSPVGHGHGLAYPSNVLDLKQKAETLGHAAAFPVVLPEFFIKAYTDEGDAVFDPFMGSGSTLMAAEKNGRIGYGTEISPAYCDVIVRRWQDFTGQQATLEATGQTFDEVSAGA